MAELVAVATQTAVAGGRVIAAAALDHPREGRLEDCDQLLLVLQPLDVASTARHIVEENDLLGDVAVGQSDRPDDAVDVLRLDAQSIGHATEQRVEQGHPEGLVIVGVPGAAERKPRGATPEVVAEVHGRGGPLTGLA